MHSPDHSTKGTPSALSLARRQWPLAAGEYVVSGSISSPCRGAFHLSLTVLVHYRSLKVFSLGGWSPLLPTRFHVPRGTQDANPSVCRRPLRDSHRLWCGFPAASSGRHKRMCWSYNPSPSCEGLVWALPGSLATTTGISVDFSCQATEMFQFAHVPPQCLCVQHWVSRHHSGWVAPFGILGFMAWMQLPPNVSPVAASFVSFQRQGIHLVLSLACHA